MPYVLLFDEDAEELSFPDLYYGQKRQFTVPATPYDIANGEIRRIDRRGVGQRHVLYMCAKVLRL